MSPQIKKTSVFYVLSCNPLDGRIVCIRTQELEESIGGFSPTETNETGKQGKSMRLSTVLLLALGATVGAQDRSNEHVALCDCKNSADTVSSQMAYYLGEPDSTPEDVATVPNTPNGQARVWPSATTSALFTLTNVTFTVKLGPQVEVGAFAGTGSNGWPSPFNCWFRPSQNLYVYDGWTCAMVYDCSHDAGG